MTITLRYNLEHEAYVCESSFNDRADAQNGKLPIDSRVKTCYSLTKERQEGQTGEDEKG